MMTPTRFALLVIVTAVMLPISPNVSAMSVAPVDNLVAEPLTTGATLDREFSLMQPYQTPVLPLLQPLSGRTKIDCKCLYFDWWYDTGGLWVQHSPNEFIAI
ncbi:MAG: hypothetical protein GF341_08330 [candidate division Zixibacteria bacterium]|nr:hypothetical protein [candidate division Zixibacteria bacterium]